MHPDVVLLMLLAAGVAAFPAIAWLRAQKRIRHLEMTLLARTTDLGRYEELRELVQRLSDQTEHLVDVNTQLAHRLAERVEPPLPVRAELPRAVTPH
jgi:ferredoxin-NADP reductase